MDRGGHVILFGELGEPKSRKGSGGECAVCQAEVDVNFTSQVCFYRSEDRSLWPGQDES